MTSPRYNLLWTLLLTPPTTDLTLTHTPLPKKKKTLDSSGIATFWSGLVWSGALCPLFCGFESAACCRQWNNSHQITSRPLPFLFFLFYSSFFLMRCSSKLRYRFLLLFLLACALFSFFFLCDMPSISKQFVRLKLSLFGVLHKL